MSVHSYKCPNCGAPLQWDAQKSNVDCEYCVSEFTIEEVEAYNQNLQRKLDQETNEKVHEAPEGFTEEEAASLRSYNCNSCGAEVVSDDTTSATFCYYCHSPVILTDRISGKFKPQDIIPFSISREKAMENFLSWAKQKPLVPKDFYSDSQLEKMTGIYLPVWLAKVNNDIAFSADAVNVNRLGGDKEEVNEFRVVRNGEIVFDNLIEVAFKKGDKVPPEAFETIANFHWDEKKPFSPAYLSGYFAELWGVSPEEAATQAETNSRTYAERVLMSEVQSNYQQVQVRDSAFNAKLDELRYVLAPAWVLTYNFNNKIYLYVMNGQTGQTFGELPIDKGRMYRTAAIIAVVIFILLMLGGQFLW